jgi:hypothetical protein
MIHNTQLQLTSCIRQSLSSAADRQVYLFLLLALPSAMQLAPVSSSPTGYIRKGKKKRMLTSNASSVLIVQKNRHIQKNLPLWMYTLFQLEIDYIESQNSLLPCWQAKKGATERD